MKKFVEIVVIAAMCVGSFSLGYHKGNWGSFFEEDPWSERNYLKEANQFKGECLNEYDKCDSILNAIIDKHADDGIWDERFDEMLESGYFSHIERIDSLYSSQI